MRYLFSRHGTIATVIRITVNTRSLAQTRRCRRKMGRCGRAWRGLMQELRTVQRVKRAETGLLARGKGRRSDPRDGRSLLHDDAR